MAFGLLIADTGWALDQIRPKAQRADLYISGVRFGRSHLLRSRPNGAATTFTRFSPTGLNGHPRIGSHQSAIRSAVKSSTRMKEPWRMHRGHTAANHAMGTYIRNFIYLVGVSAEPEKNRTPVQPRISSENRGQSSKLRRRCCTPRPQTWQARTAGRQRLTVAPTWAGSRVGVAASQSTGGISRPGETEPAALLKRDRREGLEAVGKAGKALARMEVRGADGRDCLLPSAGEQAAQAQAQARDPHAGVSAGHTMQVGRTYR
jgi:hypothetical protein